MACVWLIAFSGYTAVLVAQVSTGQDREWVALWGVATGLLFSVLLLTLHSIRLCKADIEHAEQQLPKPRRLRDFVVALAAVAIIAKF